jgi:very-short-patch-repair endonuclease
MSALEDALAFQLEAVGLPFVREVRFHPTRRWRLDFANAEKMLAIEVQGGLWIHGAHTTGKGVSRDIEKYNEAVRLGWVILYATRKTIESGECLALVEEIWEQKSYEEN